MMIEQTGTNFLDSGGERNRWWQRNEGKTLKDFYDEPAESYKMMPDGFIERTVSTFHYLLSLGLDADDKVCMKFNRTNRNATDWDADADVYGVSKNAWDELTEWHCVVVERTFNTYNNDSDLTQVVQGSWLNIDDESYLLVQVHGGCDVRGGYTDAKLFKVHFDEADYIAEYKSQDEIHEDLEEGFITL